MRFVLAVWLLILSSLVVFSSMVVSHQLVASVGFSSSFTGYLLVVTWTVGLISAGTIHLLYLRAEQAVQRAARDETVVQLAGAVAHELNQPLTVVISSAELLTNHDRSPAEMKELAGRMAEASLRMADIVGKLQNATSYHTKPYVGSIRIVDLDRTN